MNLRFHQIVWIGIGIYMGFQIGQNILFVMARLLQPLIAGLLK